MTDPEVEWMERDHTWCDECGDYYGDGLYELEHADHDDDPREAAAGYLDRAARHSVRGEVTSAMSQLEFAEQRLRGLGRTGSANVVCDIREGDVCHPSVAYELREIAQFLFVDGAEAYPEVASDGGEKR